MNLNDCISSIKIFVQSASLTLHSTLSMSETKKKKKQRKHSFDVKYNEKNLKNNFNIEYVCIVRIQLNFS